MLPWHKARGMPVVALSCAMYWSGVCPSPSSRGGDGGQRGGRVLAQGVGAIVDPQQVATDEPPVGLAHLGHRLAVAHVAQQRAVQAAVGSAGAQDGDVPHQYTPTTTLACRDDRRRRLRTPSHG
jgi:hypothetical protein